MQNNAQRLRPKIPDSPGARLETPKKNELLEVLHLNPKRIECFDLEPSLNTKGPCCENERRQAWIPLAVKDVSADDGQSCHLNSRPRSSVWSSKVARRPLMPRGPSRFILPPSHGCSLARLAPRPRMPNSVKRTMPNNFESDSQYSLFLTLAAAVRDCRRP
jgi:hypothetical protein